MADNKVVVSAAITGSIHTPTMSPYLPITPDEIARNAIEAERAGAAAVHVHARNPKNGMPTPDMNIFGEIIDKIKSESDVIICTTTGGRQGMTVDQRVAGHCRVGMEDALYVSRGTLAKNNAELVEKMVRIIREFSYEPATPDEAREILGIKTR